MISAFLCVLSCHTYILVSYIFFLNKKVLLIYFLQNFLAFIYPLFATVTYQEPWSVSVHLILIIF